MTNMAKSKIALINHLHSIEDINVKIDLARSDKNKARLDVAKTNHIKSVKQITSYLNSVGKMSDKEAISLLSLDLIKRKKFDMKFNIGGD